MHLCIHAVALTEPPAKSDADEENSGSETEVGGTKKIIIVQHVSKLITFFVFYRKKDGSVIV